MLPVLLQRAVQTILAAADVFVAVYPPDLIPHPATFYQALASGCAMLATPSKAVLAHMPRPAGSILWDTSPQSIQKQILQLTADPVRLKEAQLAAWRGSAAHSWSNAAEAVLRIFADIV